VSNKKYSKGKTSGDSTSLSDENSTDPKAYLRIDARLTEFLM